MALFCRRTPLEPTFDGQSGFVLEKSPPKSGFVSSLSGNKPNLGEPKWVCFGKSNLQSHSATLPESGFVL